MPALWSSGVSFRPRASGKIASAAPARMNKAPCQPQAPISQFSTGTIKNCPNEPAAAAIAMAQARFSGGVLRATTPKITA